MHLRIAGTANAKIAQRANFIYQLVSVLKILLCRELKVPGNIPPQSQNILNAVLLQLRYHLMNFIPGRGQAGQMRQWGHTVVQDLSCNLRCKAAGGTRSTVSNAHKGRVALYHLLDHCLGALNLVPLLGREHLKGYGGLLL